MELEFQLSKKDRINFGKLYLKDRIRKILWPLFIITILLIAVINGQTFIWWRFLISLIASPAIIWGVYYFIPLVISISQLNRTIKDDKIYLDKRKITLLDEGIKTESGNIVNIWKWQTIKSAHSNDKYLYFVLIDKSVIPIPKKVFASESEAINFLGLVQSKLPIVMGASKFKNSYTNKKPNYRLGLLCLIPLVGAVAGIIFIADGISKYKDKRYILMGFGGIVFTLGIFFISINYLGVGKAFRTGFAGNSQMELNSLMKDVEFYKIKYGVYPDSLEQVSKENPMAWTDDPLQSGWGNNSVKFNYQKVGAHYYLFSSGIDGIPNTKDDIYPRVAKSDSGKFGLIRKSY
jgi:hypothetical protein